MKRVYLVGGGARRRLWRCRERRLSAQTNEINIGITITTTGPAAALGIPERNALEFVPKEIARRAAEGDRAR